jgi:hypothetical protein
VIMNSVLTRAKEAVKKELEGLLNSELKAQLKEKEDEIKQKAEAKLQEQLGDKVKAEDIDKLKSLFK